MFKQTLKNLDKLNYILIIQAGAYKVIDRYSRKMYVSFSNTLPVKIKKRFLLTSMIKFLHKSWKAKELRKLSIQGKCEEWL